MNYNDLFHAVLIVAILGFVGWLVIEDEPPPGYRMPMVEGIVIEPIERHGTWI